MSIQVNRDCLNDLLRSFTNDTLPPDVQLASETPQESPVVSVTPHESPVVSVTTQESPVVSVTPRESPVVSVTPQQSPVVSVTPHESPVVSVTPHESPVVSVTPHESPVVSVTPPNSPDVTVSAHDSPDGPYLPQELQRCIVRWCIFLDPSCRFAFAKVSVFFRSVVQDIPRPSFHIGYGVIQNVPQPVSVRRLYLAAGQGSGLGLEIRRVVNNRRWWNAWLWLHEDQFRNFELRGIWFPG
ncbi:hypothetical protein ACOMHN_037003 [Nucella lapillus]